MKEPSVSIVILNYNGLKDIKECLNSLLKINYENFEIFVVDNNSQDDSVQFIKKKYQKVNLIQLNRNYGFAKGNNIAIPYTTGEYIVLLNQDTVVDDNWLKELVQIANKSEDIGIVGSKMYYYDDKKTIDFAGSICDKYGIIRHYGLKKTDKNLKDSVKRAFYICGASLLFKRTLYQKIGLFDPTYFMYGEDVDFCWRAWIFSYKVMYTPKSIIYHKIPKVRKNRKFKNYLADRNKIRTLAKNYNLKTLMKILPRFFFLRFRRIFKPQLIDIPSNVLMVNLIKSIYWNLINLKSLIYNRKIVQKRRKKDDKYILNLMEELKREYYYT